MVVRTRFCPVKGAKDSMIIALLRDSRASPTMEFALVAPMFIALVMGVLNLALVYLAQQGLETTAEAAARLIMTGQAQNYAGTNAAGVAYKGMTQSDFKAAACKTLPPFLTCDRLLVDVTTTNSFSAAVTSAPSLTYDASGNVTNAFSYDPGTSNATSVQTQIVVMRLLYRWPFAFKLGDAMFANYPLKASSVLLTENY
jgi:Flp pilus assembly protein TadG